VNEREQQALRERVEKAVGALFTVEAEIGRGGMAVVYRALDVRLRRKVALKVLPPELAFREDVRSRFLREAQMAAQLSHPNIVPIFAVDEHEGIVYFAMGLVEGETLAQQLARDPHPDLPAVRRILREVAEALAYAHANGLVHRDVKPDNILIERSSGHARVSDFGIARAAEGDGRLTVTGIAVGTPAYMSPEQAMGEREIDGRSDIYSLGVVGYQMLAGSLPFSAGNTPAMLMKHISEQPRPLHEVRPDLPANLVNAIERAMAKGKGDRWADALAFRDALAEDAVVGRASRSHPATAGVDHVDRPRPSGRDEPRDEAPRGADGATRSPSYYEMKQLWRQQAEEYREARREQLRDMREDGREAILSSRDARRLARAERKALRVGVSLGDGRELRALFDESLQTPEERIRRFQKRFFSSLGTVALLFGINVAMGGFPWVIFPALGFGIGLARRLSGMLIDGIPLKRVFTVQPVVAVGAERAPGAEGSTVRGVAGSRVAALPSTRPDTSGVSPEVLNGPVGATVRDAAEARAEIRDVLARLPEAERQLLPPEVQPTVDALVQRIFSLAASLHQLDTDASSFAMEKLEHRIAEARATSDGSSSRERMLELLERQLATIKELSTKRDGVRSQLESASTVLQTMRLDLLKLRSNGLDTRLEASTGATQEARALSRDIGRAIEAADEVRKL
jgi:serine/threonine protein kinase